MIVLLIVGLVLMTVGIREGYRGNCGLATDACSVVGGLTLGFVVVRMVMT